MQGSDFLLLRLRFVHPVSQHTMWQVQLIPLGQEMVKDPAPVALSYKTL